ncbi:MAG: hypothetical protein IJ404_06845 [Clostridia bacterium]|nr:hypothetical protein [Clostridia bacterium]
MDKKQTKRSSAQRQKKLLPPKLKMLVTVVNRSKTELFLDYISGFEVNMQMSMAASGTASSDMLTYLGLTDTDKTVIFSVIREDKEDMALRFLEDKFKTVKNGKGIAFTVSMTGVIGVAIYQFLSNSGK